ncbi:MAG: phenylalanine--tRNA ligase subunit beta [Acidobacteria bacterium]|nr:phenylalanine--tRNA ligase subunit beta [Acidobacteriota bacterium]
MKLPVDWLRDFAEIAASPADVAGRLAACGFAVESLDGDVVDVEVTANRPDCLSIVGLAREAAVAFDVPLRLPMLAGTQAVTGTSDAGDANGTVRVAIEAPDCRRYALAVADVHVGPSPDWLAARLAAAGVRAINNIVDVTNYVMLELGHPMHAFDAARLAGREIRVRPARPGESIVTIDGETRRLDEAMLLIADRESPIAVAGVMGGAASEVSRGTTRIALESAWFRPASIRATSRRLGLKTEASIRFERGADLEAPVVAIRRALALLEEIGAGRVAGAVADVYPRVATPRIVRLRRDRTARLLGDVVPDAEVARILGHLGFGLQGTDDGWDVEVPIRRVDVSREADLIEEVGRHWGYDRIPATLPAVGRPAPPRTAAVVETRLRSLARAAGLQEAVTFTFVERAAAEPFAGSAPLVAIANPLSDKFAVLRPSMLPGLLDALVYNRRRDAEDVRLFEMGSVFHHTGEATRIGWVLTGPREAHWSGGASALDFYDAKGVAELLVQAAGVQAADVTAVPADDVPWFVRGRSARLLRGQHGEALGSIGQIRPDLLARRGLDAGVVVGGELDVTALVAIGAAASDNPHVRAVPRFPSIVRDLSIVVSERLPAATVRGTIRANAPDTLQSIVEFDRYQGKGVPDGHVSLSLRLTFRHPDRTLTDQEAQHAVDAIVDALGQAHGATLRGKP